MAVDLRLRILDADAAGPELERGALQLGDELRGLDVDAVGPLVEGEAPEGSRGPAAAALGGLLVSLHPGAGVLAALVGTVRAWLRRPGAAHTVRLEVDGDVLELTGTTTEVQERLVEQWIRTHAAGVGSG